MLPGMNAPPPAPGDTCLDCEAVAVVRATCCGRPCCEEHRIANATCFLCEGALASQHNAWMMPRMGIVLLGWGAGLAPYVVLRELWTLVAIVPALALAMLTEARLHRFVRRRLLGRRARSHGWTRPPTMPVPAAGRATLMDGMKDNKILRVMRSLSRFGG